MGREWCIRKRTQLVFRLAEWEIIRCSRIRICTRWKYREVCIIMWLILGQHLRTILRTIINCKKKSYGIFLVMGSPVTNSRFKTREDFQCRKCITKRILNNVSMRLEQERGSNLIRDCRWHLYWLERSLEIKLIQRRTLRFKEPGCLLRIRNWWLLQRISKTIRRWMVWTARIRRIYCRLTSRITHRYSRTILQLVYHWLVWLCVFW